MKLHFYRNLSTFAVSLLLTACNVDQASTDSPQSTVNIYSSVENCTSDIDVPNCHFKTGVYVLKLDTGITDEQHQRVKDQVSQYFSKSSNQTRALYNQKRIVIGLMADEPNPSSPSTYDSFVLKLADSMNSRNGVPKVLDGIELVYTNLAGKDETLKLTTYQKLIQLFDYYIDGNSNTTAGVELKAAYQAFLAILSVQASSGLPEHLLYNPCNYGNGQLLANTCPISSEDTEGKGSLDPIHSLNSDLNPGAIIGLAYEYMLDPSKAEIGELKGSSGTVFQNTGLIGQGTANAINWSNPAFKPLADYIKKWHLTN